MIGARRQKLRVLWVRWYERDSDEETLEGGFGYGIF